MNSNTGPGNGKRGAGNQISGFTLIELLIALGITLAISSAIAALTPSARIMFERVPAELEVQQRGRTAIEALTQAVRAAGKDVAAANLLGTMADLFPAITLLEPDDSGTAYKSLRAIVPVPDPAQGVLDVSQASSSSPITLAIAACPNVKDVCGFTSGVAAVIVDSAGHFDVFVVSSTSAGARRLTPDRALSRAYAAGSVVAEIEEHTFRLDEQPDGSSSLIRVTAAGAVQPVVDYLSSLTFVFEHQQLDITLGVQPFRATGNAGVARTFQTSIRLRNGP